MDGPREEAPRAAEKTRAEEVAKNTTGVTSVVNNLKVATKKN